MMELAAPLGLAVLAALALPIVIHFLRRTEEHELSFAAMRWLSDQTRTSTKLRLHERLLLAVRLLLLASLALLLALPVWRSASPGAAWVVVAPGVDAGVAQAAVDLPSAEWHWLAPGYPDLNATRVRPVSDTTLTPRGTSLSSLVRGLDAMLPAATPLTLVVPQELGELDAERLRLGRSVDWRIVPGRSPEHEQRAEPAPLQIAVRSAADRAEELRVVRALERAWELAGHAVTLDIASSDTPIPEDADRVLWLDAGAMPVSLRTWIEHGGTALVSNRPDDTGSIVLTDEQGRAALREHPLGRGRMLSTPAAFTVEQMPMLASPDFPERLHAVLSAPVAPPDRAPAATMSPARETGHATGPRTSLDGIVALIAALLFLAERAWATRLRAWRS